MASDTPMDHRRSSPRATVATVLIALMLGALMNGPGLVRAATGLEVGPVRTAALAVAEGIAWTGQRLGLERPRQRLASLRDGHLGTALGLAHTSTDDRAEVTRGPTTDAAAPGIPPAGTPLGPGPHRDDTPLRAVPSPPGRSDTPGLADTPGLDDTTGPRDARRTVTAAEPLQVLLLGDSLIGAIADGFGRYHDGDERVRWASDVRISTGLARPDVLDWHHHLDAQLAVHDPDVVVLMLGGNDDQSLLGAPGGVIHWGQPGWDEEYTRRVAELQRIAAADGRLVVWLTLPAMRPERLEAARLRMNAAARQVAPDTGVLVLETGPILSPDGYTSRLAGTPVRAADGVHLTHPGGDLVATAIAELLRAHTGLDR